MFFVRFILISEKKIPLKPLFLTFPFKIIKNKILQMTTTNISTKNQKSVFKYERTSQGKYGQS